jgi:tetratricopeptide (TPR) repeat protein
VLESGPETRLSLERGSLACDVSERAVGGSFTVEASGFLVRVTGTRFLVDLGARASAARVVVSAGVVEVRRGAGAHGLKAGERLEIEEDVVVGPASEAELAEIDGLFGGPPTTGEAVARVDALPDPESAAADQPSTDAGAAPFPPTRAVADGPGREADVEAVSELERWRELVIEGRLDEARSALRDHLAAHPADAEAWSLLADCERKRGSWNAAVEAYDELVSLSRGAQANRARFKAAQILQDRLGDHRRAVELLGRFVEGADPGGVLTAKARVRLARSLLALGRQDRARAQLRQVIASATDDETLATARQMLERLERE